MIIFSSVLIILHLVKSDLCSHSGKRQETDTPAQSEKACGQCGQARNGNRRHGDWGGSNQLVLIHGGHMYLHVQRYMEIHGDSVEIVSM